VDSVVVDHPCSECERLRGHILTLQESAQQLESTIARLLLENAELCKLIAVQKADIERYRKAYERIEPSCPERVAEEQLQLAFLRVLQEVGEGICLDDALTPEVRESQGKEPEKTEDKPRKKRRHNHGRRRLDLTNLPVKTIVIDPEEVLQSGGDGYRMIGQEVSDRLAYQHAGYIRLRLERRKWVRVGSPDGSVTANDADKPGNLFPLPPVVIAPLPPGLWPHHMAEASTISNVILSKYGDCLPLNRQETISERQGFIIPRSTQCSWLTSAYELAYRVVDAMLAEAKEKAFCLATDATGAPVKSVGACDRWHVFVLLADQDHVVFQYTEKHTQERMEEMLSDYQGYLLADASNVYEKVYGRGVVEVGCWYHTRRYFWKALESDAPRASEALSIIAKLFVVERECSSIPMPQRTKARAERARPVLKLLDRWVKAQKSKVDERSPLAAALTYYRNQRTALRQFLKDGRLPLTNSGSERALRNLALGRHNWLYFANETGVRWYVVFRSLLASCAPHDLNAQQYLEELLRLVPHWPVNRMLELSPRYWQQTRNALSEEHRQLLLRPWDLPSRTVEQLDASPLVVDPAA